MSLFVDQLENLCRTGAEQLSVDARKRLCDALQRLHVPSGGYAGLDGAPDPYYSFFVYQCLTALGAPIDRDALLDYAAQCAPQTYVDRVAAEALRQACTAQWSPTAALRLLLRSSSESEAYGRFFALWQADRAFSPRILSWWARIAWLGLRKQVVQRPGLVMPHLAVGLVIAHVAGDRAATRQLITRIQRYRVAGGGFACMVGHGGDLLATAVAVAALRMAGAKHALNRHREIDRDFVELCWLGDDLFGATPLAEKGDAEYTFYGMLALGALSS